MNTEVLTSPWRKTNLFKCLYVKRLVTGLNPKARLRNSYKKIQLTGARSQKTQEINPTANKADKEQMKTQNQGQKLQTGTKINGALG